MSSDSARIGPKPLEALVEDARLATLQGYRNLRATDLAGLSRLCGEAARGFAASHAAVSFVDDARVWFAGSHGFDVGHTPRLGGFCDAVVRAGRPLLVPDARDDARLRHHPLVDDVPGLRSYAGVPLIDGGGYVLGTVAVFSVQPDAFRPAVLDGLSGLAGLVRDYLDDVRIDGVAAPPMPPPRPVQGWLGVKTAPIKSGRGDREDGLIVVSVARRSPADEVGLRPTDILHSIDAEVMTAVPHVAAAMADRVPGSTVRLRFRRSGQWHECDVPIRQHRKRLKAR